ncbi:hypothetical protein HDV00_000855 [Rhizophlyctis rosea]|nr:hypothetical protein HDV00_000855 [Rhizophlyctis rosea]
MLEDFYLRCPVTQFKDTHVDELMRILDRDDSTDVRLLVGNKQTVITAHSAVLSASSDFFKALFSSSQWKENGTGTVELPKLEASAVQAVVAWMYTSHYCSKCFLQSRDRISRRPGGTFITEAMPLPTAIQVPITLHYLLASPMPDHDVMIQPIVEMINLQNSAKQQIYWKTIQDAKIGGIITAAIPILAGNADIKQIISLIEMTEELEHLKSILKAAFECNRRDSIKVASDVFQLIGCLVDWVEAKQKMEDHEAVKAMLLDFLKELGGEF